MVIELIPPAFESLMTWLLFFFAIVTAGIFVAFFLDLGEDLLDRIESWKKA